MSPILCGHTKNSIPIPNGQMLYCDQWTSRCRLPLPLILSRSAASSLHMILLSSNNSTCAICIAAPSSQSSHENERDICFDATISLQVVQADSFFISIANNAIDLSSEHKLYWIPAEHIVDAYSVNLVLVKKEESNAVAQAVKLTLSCDTTYANYVKQVVRSGYVVRRDAILRLPLPLSVGKEIMQDYCEFRFDSVLPAKAYFVRITDKCRVHIERSSKERGDSVKYKSFAINGTIVGLDKERQLLRDMILIPTLLSKTEFSMGKLPQSVLIHGPSGVGKTLLVQNVIAECCQTLPIALESIHASALVAHNAKNAKYTLKDILKRCKQKYVNANGVCVLYVDGLEAFNSNQQSSQTGAQIVIRILQMLDTLSDSRIFVIGVTNVAEDAFVRSGHFDYNLHIDAPDAQLRGKILQLHLNSVPIQCAVQDRDRFIDNLAAHCIGYVGSDIAALCREAFRIAYQRHAEHTSNELYLKSNEPISKIISQAIASTADKLSSLSWRINPTPVWYLQNKKLCVGSRIFQTRTDLNSKASIDKQSLFLAVNLGDFESAKRIVTPSTLRGAAALAAQLESRSWGTIGGHEDVKLELQQTLEWPFKYKSVFDRFGIKPARGFLLYGPPGCSKSSLARAAATSSGVTFFTLSPASVFSPFVGAAEATIRQTFADARAALPAVIFLDEVDVLAGKRAFSNDADGKVEGSAVSIRILSTLLNELDGIEAADGLTVIGATNRPECVDAALLRPGRFDRSSFISLPTKAERLKILCIHTSAMQLHKNVSLERIAARTEYFSGAELENICRESALHALREDLQATEVRMQHFDLALSTARPISDKNSLEHYIAFSTKRSGKKRQPKSDPIHRQLVYPPSSRASLKYTQYSF